MAAGFDLNSGISLTRCPECHNVTQYYLDGDEVLCTHCSSVFTVIQDSDDANSLPDIVASEDSDPPDEMLEKPNQDHVRDDSSDSEGDGAMSENMKELISLLTEETRKCMNNEIASRSESILGLQVLNIEELNSCANNDDSNESIEMCTAKIKIMATLLVPVTIEHCNEMDEGGSGAANDEFLEEVPESFYFDFRYFKREADFSNEQVWVSYSCEDRMPRDFLRVKKVMSRNPFRLQVAILEPVEILSAKFSTCGSYQPNEELRIMDDIAAFSHMVTYQKVRKGLIKICPARGQVWALYKDWNKKDGCNGKKMYEIVKISSVKEDAVTVIPLVRFGRARRTVYMDKSFASFEVANDKLIQFSHEIPFYKIQHSLSATEILDGCYELDPAAIPPELF